MARWCSTHNQYAWRCEEAGGDDCPTKRQKAQYESRGPHFPANEIPQIAAPTPGTSESLSRALRVLDLRAKFDATGRADAYDALETYCDSYTTVALAREVQRLSTELATITKFDPTDEVLGTAKTANELWQEMAEIERETQGHEDEDFHSCSRCESWKEKRFALEVLKRDWGGQWADAVIALSALKKHILAASGGQRKRAEKAEDQLAVVDQAWVSVLREHRYSTGGLSLSESGRKFCNCGAEFESYEAYLSHIQERISEHLNTKGQTK